MKQFFNTLKNWVTPGAERPELSIIVVCFNMRREAVRTIFSLSARHQKNVVESEYEIILVDNGSTLPLDRDEIEAIGSNVRYHYLDTDSESPAAAVNVGVSMALGKYIACIVDGARMVTPQIVHYSLQACRRSSCPYITSLAWHLGHKEQNEALLEGYNQQVEDELLNSVDWHRDGYALFRIASQASSSRMGLLGGLPYESSFFAMLKSQFVALGGFDERFTSPGGGLVNHAFLNTVIDAQRFEYFVLLGEGSFHQFHGGVATNAKPSEHPMQLFLDEYQRIYDRPYAPHEEMLNQDICYIGSAPTASLRFLIQVEK